MKLDEMFKKYPDNLIGFRVNGDVKVIDFWLDPTWSILEDHVPDEIKLKKGENLTKLCGKFVAPRF